MIARDRGSARSGRRALIGLAVVVLACAGVAPAVAAKKKKKKTAAAATRSIGVALSPGAGASATPTCAKKTHITGGGYSVESPFTPSALTGTRAVTTTSKPEGLRTWSTAASAYAVPTVGTTFSGHARCESDTLGKLTTIRSGGGAVPIDTVATVNNTCLPDSHVISGGFEISGPPSLVDPSKVGVIVLRSQRTAVNQWTVTVLNPGPPVGVATGTVSGFALCERNGKGQSVSEVSSVAAIGDDARTVAEASCSSKQHVVSGGFNVTPNTVGSASPAVSLDVQLPVGKRAWRSELYEVPGAVPPAGSTLTNIAYCKKGK